MQTVIAIDPGVNTGLVVAHVDEEVEILHFDQFICSTHVETVELINRYLDQYPGATVVAEQFDLRPSNKFTADLTPVKVNAVLDWLVDDIHYQTPAQAKGLVKDATLKNLGR